jgi:protein TonB
MLLTLRVVDPQRLQRVLPPAALELILVNAYTPEAPLQATALAQANLDGGGLADQGQATTPLEASPQVRAGEDLEEVRRQVQRMAQDQQLLLSQIQAQLARLEAMPPGEAEDGDAATAERERRRALADLAAKIERRIQQENARPRKRFISAAARQTAFAAYYDEMRQQLEAEGTQDFPQANGRRLYGELTLSFSIQYDGRVLQAKVLASSGQPDLDAQALALLRRQRFPAFDRDLRRETDQLAVVSTLHFMREGVRSEWEAQP